MAGSTYSSINARAGLFSELWRYRALVSNLILRDLKAQNKRSVLGVAWMVISPLLTMTILTLLFSEIFGAQLKEGSFPLYVISGLLLWTLFSSASAGGLPAITISGSIIRRVYVPKAVFPISAVAASYLNFLISLIALLAFMVIARAPFTWHLLSALLATLEVAVFSLGAAMVLATLHVFFRDVKWFYDSALLVGFYMTPIFYPAEIIGNEYLPLLRLNPLWSMLNAFRNPVVYGLPPNLIDLAVGGGAALAALALGWLVFKRYDSQLINYL